MHQKVETHSCNKQLHNFGISPLFMVCIISEGSFAEVGQMITGMKFASFLTPDMASKNYARHAIY